MIWEFIKENRLSRYVRRGKAHYLFPLLTGALGVWTGMLLTPTIGALCFVITIFLVFIIFFPWGKFRGKYSVYISVIITFLIVLPNWNRLVSIFPTTDPYQQPLMTGKARVDVTISSKDENLGTQHRNSWCYSGRVFLVTGPELFLEMWIVTVPGIHVERVGNNQLRYSGDLELHPNNKSTGKPIHYLRKAEAALIFIYDNMPKEGDVISGELILTLNSAVRVEIPIPPQTVKGDEPIIILDIQKYFKNGSNKKIAMR